jgi:hypothetical protein
VDVGVGVEVGVVVKGGVVVGVGVEAGEKVGVNNMILKTESVECVSRSRSRRRSWSRSGSCRRRSRSSSRSWSISCSWGCIGCRSWSGVRGKSWGWSRRQS